jgi:hypothetical protein
VVSAVAEAHGVVSSRTDAGRWLCRFQANNFYLSRDDSGRAPLESRWKPVALAVAPKLALLNHSCFPNCHIVSAWSAPPGGDLAPAPPAGQLALVARTAIEVCRGVAISCAVHSG